MLQQLHITNYALIDDLDVAFASGLNIITGETGAGKSIMLGALALIFGGRAETHALRRGDKKSVIECTFDASHTPQLRQYCAEHDIDWLDDNQIILRREIAPNGRSRAFINDSPASVTALGEVAMHLVDIHSQHNNMLLSKPRFQLDIIDALADNAGRLQTYAIAFDKLRRAIAALKSKRAELKKTADNADFIQYQLSKITAVNPQPGEIDDLNALHARIAESVELKSHITEALATINGADSILEKVDRLTAIFETYPSAIEGAEETVARLTQIRIELSDIAHNLRLADKDLNCNPAELEYVENRLTKLQDLLDRFNVATPDELFALRDTMQQSLDELKNATVITKQIEAEARAAMTEARTIATEISQARRSAAQQFADRLKQEATPLGMHNLQVKVDIAETDLSSTGFDKVTFLCAFNKNQPLMPVADSASGGEISRLMLCIKAIIADKMEYPSILFDEIDTGISGAIAVKMGEMMHRMSQNLQTIVITHLPQVAAAGDSHYKVYKYDDTLGTHTRIIKLNPEQRIDEIATMLGGDPANEASRLNAMALLNSK